MGKISSECVVGWLGCSPIQQRTNPPRGGCRCRCSCSWGSRALICSFFTTLSALPTRLFFQNPHPTLDPLPSFCPAFSNYIMWSNHALQLNSKHPRPSPCMYIHSHYRHLPKSLPYSNKSNLVHFHTKIIIIIKIPPSSLSWIFLCFRSWDML